MNVKIEIKMNGGIRKNMGNGGHRCSRISTIKFSKYDLNLVGYYAPIRTTAV